MKFLAKIIFSISLVAWLIYKDRLNLNSFNIFIERPAVLGVYIFNWIIFGVFLSTFRWMILCRALNINLKTSVMMRLYLIGCFFNISMPSVVGGDLIKAYYVSKQDANTPLSTALVSVFFDRICGLIGIFIIAIISLYDPPQKQSSQLDWVIDLTGYLAAASLFGLLVMFIIGPKINLARYPKITGLLEKFRLDKVVNAFLMFSNRKSAVMGAIGLSIFIQLATMGLFYLATQVLVPDVKFVQICAAYPLAAFISALPLSPAGLGTGHYAYEKLFDIAGIGEGVGANVFNLYFCANILFNLIGVIPYLSYRKTMGNVVATR